MGAIGPNAVPARVRGACCRTSGTRARRRAHWRQAGAGATRRQLAQQRLARGTSVVGDRPARRRGVGLRWGRRRSIGRDTRCCRRRGASAGARVRRARGRLHRPGHGRAREGGARRRRHGGQRVRGGRRTVFARPALEVTLLNQAHDAHRGFVGVAATALEQRAPAQAAIDPLEQLEIDAIEQRDVSWMTAKHRASSPLLASPGALGQLNDESRDGSSTNITARAVRGSAYRPYGDEVILTRTCFRAHLT